MIVRVHGAITWKRVVAAIDKGSIATTLTNWAISTNIPVFIRTVHSDGSVIYSNTICPRNTIPVASTKSFNSHLRDLYLANKLSVARLDLVIIEILNHSRYKYVETPIDHATHIYSCVCTKLFAYYISSYRWSSIVTRSYEGRDRREETRREIVRCCMYILISTKLRMAPTAAVTLARHTGSRIERAKSAA